MKYLHSLTLNKGQFKMKNVSILLTGVVFLFLITSCLKNDQQDYYSALGIVSKTNDSVIIISDQGNRLLVSNTQSLGSTIGDKDRVIANFTLVNKTLPAHIDYIIDVYAIEKVLFKPVIELTSNIADSIGNDELEINSIQLVKDFLNLDFTFYGNAKKHYINLIRYPGPIPTDTVDLEIRHNNNNDNNSYSAYAFVSFDLTSLRNNVADSVILRIRAKEFNSRTFERYFTYKY